MQIGFAELKVLRGQTEGYLPYRGRSLQLRDSIAEKSAEVIVPRGNEVYKIHRSHEQGMTERNPSRNQIGSIDFHYWVTDSQENLQPSHKVWNSFNRCKERLERWVANRRIRDPYVRWCERRTPAILVGAVYSIGKSLLFLLIRLSKYSKLF